MQGSQKYEKSWKNPIFLPTKRVENSPEEKIIQGNLIHLLENPPSFLSFLQHYRKRFKLSGFLLRCVKYFNSFPVSCFADVYSKKYHLKKWGIWYLIHIPYFHGDVFCKTNKCAVLISLLTRIIPLTTLCLEDYKLSI